MTTGISRREVLRLTAAGGATLAAGGLLAACAPAATSNPAAAAVLPPPETTTVRIVKVAVCDPELYLAKEYMLEGFTTSAMWIRHKRRPVGSFGTKPT